MGSLKCSSDSNVLPVEHVSSFSSRFKHLYSYLLWCLFLKQSWCLYLWDDVCRNSLFLLKNIFIHRICTKIFYKKIILQRKFYDVGWLPATHQHFPNCCLYILVYGELLTQQAISFSPAISSACGVISINAHHTRLVKLFLLNLVCAKKILHEFFFDENLLDEKKRITL